MRIRRVADGVLLEAIIRDPKELFKKIDEIDSEFMPEGREQPLAPTGELFD